MDQARRILTEGQLLARGITNIEQKRRNASTEGLNCKTCFLVWITWVCSAIRYTLVCGEMVPFLSSLHWIETFSGTFITCLDANVNDWCDFSWTSCLGGQCQALYMCATSYFGVTEVLWGLVSTFTLAALCFWTPQGGRKLYFLHELQIPGPQRNRSFRW